MKRIEDEEEKKEFDKVWVEFNNRENLFETFREECEHFYVEGRESALKEVREARYQEGVKEIEIKSSETLRKMPELFLNHTVSPSLAFMQTENKDSKAKRTIVQLISHNGDLRALTSDGRIYRLMEDEFGDETWVRDEDSIPER